MKRKIISIDEGKCDGCGQCIPNCPEGALQIIDGKARLVNDVFCDGLGACLGHCPQGAITVEEREAAEYDERQVMTNVVKQGAEVIHSHLNHLREHGEEKLLAEAVRFLDEQPALLNFNPRKPMKTDLTLNHDSGCPGSRAMSFKPAAAAPANKNPERSLSQLTHWPIQLHLISPKAPHYQGSDLLLAADCAPFTLPDFHRDYLRGKTLAIACPKLDEGQEVYVEKLRLMVDEARINTLTVIIMQVPCCMGLLRLAQEAVSRAARKVPVKCIIVGLQGEILKEDWV